MLNINDQINYLNELKSARERLRGVLLGEGYIVIIEGVPLKFDIVNKSVSNPQPSSPHAATRFTFTDACRIAREIHNGNDEIGQAMHVNTALDQFIIQHTQLIELMQKHARI